MFRNINTMKCTCTIQNCDGEGIHTKCCISEINKWNNFRNRNCCLLFSRCMLQYWYQWSFFRSKSEIWQVSLFNSIIQYKNLYIVYRYMVIIRGDITNSTIYTYIFIYTHYIYTHITYVHTVYANNKTAELALLCGCLEQ